MEAQVACGRVGLSQEIGYSRYEMAAISLSRIELMRPGVARQFTLRFGAPALCRVFGATTPSTFSNGFLLNRSFKNRDRLMSAPLDQRAGAPIPSEAA